MPGMSGATLQISRPYEARSPTPLPKFPFCSKRQDEPPLAQQLKRQEESPSPRQPNQWGFVVSWALSAFLFGLATAHPPRLDPIVESASRVGFGLILAIFTALTVGIYKYFRRDSGRLFGPSLTDTALSADKTVFWLSISMAVFFLAMAFYLQRYIGLVDASLCGLLGVGVRVGSTPSRWLLAVYAFLSPVLVVFSAGSSSGVLWPFLFFVVCRSILAHQRESQFDAVNGIAVRNAPHSDGAPTTDATHKHLDHGRMSHPPNQTPDQAWDGQFSDVAKTMSSFQSTTSPIALVSVSAEPSQHTTETLEDHLYGQIAHELEADTVDKGLWTKAYAQAEGDDKQTRVLYIKLRFARLLSMERDRKESSRPERK